MKEKETKPPRIRKANSQRLNAWFIEDAEKPQNPKHDDADEANDPEFDLHEYNGQWSDDDEQQQDFVNTFNAFLGAAEEDEQEDSLTCRAGCPRNPTL